MDELLVQPLGGCDSPGPIGLRGSSGRGSFAWDEDGAADKPVPFSQPSIYALSGDPVPAPERTVAGTVQYPGTAARPLRRCAFAKRLIVWQMVQDHTGPLKAV
jgi:hypothetical protein